MRLWTTCNKHYIKSLVEDDDIYGVMSFHREEDLDSNLYKRVVRKDALKVSAYLMDKLALDPAELFEIAVLSNSLDCIKYFSQFVNPQEIILTNLRGVYRENVAFLYTHGYLSYESCFVFTGVGHDRKLLSWLRGEQEIEGRILSYHPWPPGIMGIFSHRGVLEWLRGDRLWGACPWNSRILNRAIQQECEHIVYWARSGDDPCPWNASVMENALENKKTNIIRFLRSGDDPCPWPSNIADIVVGLLDLYELLKELNCPTLPINMRR